MQALPQFTPLLLSLPSQRLLGKLPLCLLTGSQVTTAMSPACPQVLPGLYPLCLLSSTACADGSECFDLKSVAAV